MIDEDRLVPCSPALDGQWDIHGIRSPTPVGREGTGSYRPSTTISASSAMAP
jgi:hypothetical protein